MDAVPCSLAPGETIYLVDTPGFDDMERSDTDILLEISAWLAKAHKAKLKLAGIIYLHRITDVRIGGSVLTNLKMFRSLCGDQNLESVVLATTMWDKDVKGEGEFREAMLREEKDFWGSMIDNGSKVLRHDKKKTSGLDILRYLISRKKKVTLDIQTEMVDQDKRLCDTSAGIVLQTDAQKLQESYEKRIANLELQLQTSANQAREEMERLKADLEKKISKLDADAIKRQADYKQIIADEQKRIEKLIQEKEWKQTQRQDEGKRRRMERNRKVMHARSCVIL